MPTSRWREVRYCDWQKGERYISDIIIPKFHAMSHQSRCQLLLYNSCCPLLAAQINGEGPERPWAAVRENTSRLWPLRAKFTAKGAKLPWRSMSGGQLQLLPAFPVLPLNLCLLGFPSGICPSPFFCNPIEQSFPTVLGDKSTGGRSG
ncbi:hypothetical protein DFH08DRAFT_942835 [Mycena albidolilacea]|uniref:Uncharacterized protein n=1 Tax=Mycena albidolilacea TaxID=1033008 RepID=A0AAD7EE07_9AGAR|nr:hypothetical protein DFH08DRAFT_942835 [Mycena albidolilacea]